MSSDSTNNDVDEIVESYIPTEPSKSFEFSCVEYSFMVVPTAVSYTHLTLPTKRIV